MEVGVQAPSIHRLHRPVKIQHEVFQYAVAVAGGIRLPQRHALAAQTPTTTFQRLQPYQHHLR